jgi:DegV family protein with EDD domain
VPRVAIVTDSASDLPLDVATAAGITVVPLAVNFGDQTYKAIVELASETFWERMLAPGAPWPTTAAASPGDFKAAYERCFAEGAEAVVAICISSELSGTLKSATIARDMLPDREIHVIDTRTASMGQGLLALHATELADADLSAADIASEIERRIGDVDLYVALDGLEYLRKGGRITATQAAIGSLLAVKPIITVRDGKVDVHERVRTRTKARERVLELLTEGPVERLAVLYSPGADAPAFSAEAAARMPGGISAEQVTIELIGPSIGPHLGPGCIGGVLLRPSS